MSEETSDLIKQIVKIISPSIAQLFIILFLFNNIPNQNLITFLLIIIATNLSFKLFQGQPIIKEWIKTSISIIIITTALYFLIKWFGAMGGLFGVLFILIFVGLAIFQNWKLYDRLTTWGALRIKGKTKEAFRIKEETNDKENHL